MLHAKPVLRDALIAAIILYFNADSTAQCDLRDLARLDSGESAVGQFGGSVDIDGGRALVGFARGQTAYGKAFLFEGQGISWAIGQTLVPNDGPQGFGSSVSISGDFAVIGAPLDDVSFSNSGSVYVFENQAGTWNQVAKLMAPDAAANAIFGYAVCIAGDRVVIGAPGDGVLGPSAGAIYIFERQGAAWDLISKLYAADFAAQNRLGMSVAAFGDAAIAGVGWGDAAYIFEKLGPVWWQTAKLGVPDGEVGTAFGYSVGICEDLAIVGALGHTTSAGGTNNVAFGTAYIFRRVGAFWQLASTLAAEGGYFGKAVAIDQRRAVVGAPQAHLANNSVGIAYVFEESSPEWILTETLLAPDGQANDRYGTAAALSGQNCIIGSPLDDTLLGTNIGSAYVTQTYSTDSFDEYGMGCAGSGGFTPSLTLTGCGAPGNAITFAVTDGVGGGLALFFLGASRGSLVLGSGCEFLTAPTAAALFAVPLVGSGPGAGQAVFMAGVPLVPPAPSFTIQSFILDGGVPRGFSSTNGVEAFLRY